MAANVVDQYMNLYIPQAIALADELEAEGGPARFVWTTGSWLIHEYLKQTNGERRRQLEAAIGKGHIVWHGLPFTTHTELMDPALFAYGLSLAERLDRMFGKRTIAAKMTDVPGHTRAVISPMAGSGIQYLHLGVNPASKVPDVPGVFVWRARDGSDIVVNYADNYGNALVIDGLKDALVFAHTGDNCGPPPAAAIRKQFERLAERFPGADIRASTMDAFAAALLKMKHRLPVVEEEIGDTWIHGVASDPLKVAQLRALLRLRSKWLQEGQLVPDSREYDDFSGNLLLIAEHTWGMDEKKFLCDFKHYAKREFAKARQEETIAEDAVPDKYKYISSFAMDELDSLSGGLFSSGKLRRSFVLFERAWEEQRNYIRQAVESLSEEKRREAERCLTELVPVRATGPAGQTLLPGLVYRLGSFEVMFAGDGSISGLKDGQGKQWSDDNHRIGVIRYETFGAADYGFWFQHYVENIDKTHVWADADFGKPGMENLRPQPAHRLFEPILKSLVMENANGEDVVHVRLGMPEEAVDTYGSPGLWHMEYRFGKRSSPGIVAVTLQWFDKQANRLPEAAWFSFAPRVNNPNLWKLDKMGESVSPLEVVCNGSRNLHAVHTGVHYRGADGSVSIETLDAPVVAPGARKILQFDNQFAPLSQGFHFLLHNNVWGTNFPMWYEDEGKFRFIFSCQSFG